MAMYTTETHQNGDLPTNTHAGMAMEVRVSLTFATAITLALGDVIRLAKLPANYALTNVELDIDSLGAAAVGSVGLLNAAETAVEKPTHTGQNLAVAGVFVGNKMDARRTPIDEENSTTIGVVITTAASAALAQGAVIGATIRYRAKQVIEA